MVNAPTTATGTPNERALRDDLEALKTDIGTLKEDLRSFADNAGSAARHASRDAAERIRSGSRTAYDFGREKAKWAKEEVSGRIEEHPFAAVGIAFGVGILVGALVARR
ncbi:MAG TPA: hypothetical protein PKE29_10995 [Phycisphaerales bacterium]|nr:hypothetical protein [Phycisphaerales bacterium]